MVETFARYWPAEVRLVVYTEGFRVPHHKNVFEQHFPPWFFKWKAYHADSPDANGRDRQRNRRGREHDYRRDCVKFSHKVAAITDAAIGSVDDLVIWMDADTITHAGVDEAWLEGLFPSTAAGFMAWLDRARVYPECGFMMFRPRHAMSDSFFRRLQHLYESGEVFKLSETHDSFVIAHLVKRCVADRWFPEPHSLSGPKARLSHHPFVLSALGERLDHAKGRRKATNRTPSIEVKGHRDEEYWRQ